MASLSPNSMTLPPSGETAAPVPLVESRFLVRLNRFAAMVDLDGTQTVVHVANSGRMKELLVPGNPVWLRRADNSGRKTAFDLAIVDLGHTLASTDAQLPNTLILRAFHEGRLGQFEGFSEARPEVTYGDSRLDILLKGDQGLCYVEAKSVTLVVNGVGLFPDAPTTRGKKHILTLVRALEEGHRAAVVFVVQRDDSRAFSPNYDADPDFGQALRMAVDAGVEAYAYGCHVSLSDVSLAGPLPVKL